MSMDGTVLDVPSMDIVPSHYQHWLRVLGEVVVAEMWPPIEMWKLGEVECWSPIEMRELGEVVLWSPIEMRELGEVAN